MSFCGVTSSELEEAVLDPTKFDRLMKQIDLREALISEVVNIDDPQPETLTQEVTCQYNRHHHVHLECLVTLSGNLMSVRGSGQGLLVFSTPDAETMFKLMEDDKGTREILSLLQEHSEVRFFSDQCRDLQPSESMIASLAREICTDERGVCWNALFFRLYPLLCKRTNMIPMDIARYINALCLFQDIRDKFPTPMGDTAHFIIAEYAMVDDDSEQKKILCGFGCGH